MCTIPIVIIAKKWNGPGNRTLKSVMPKILKENNPIKGYAPEVSYYFVS
jgi:hypothetical protein